MSDDIRLKAIDYVLGIRADGAPEAGFERHADPALDTAICEIEALLRDIEGVGPVSEGNALFARILSGVATSTDGAWIEPQPGTAIRPLWDDRTFLMRCAEGTSFPVHRHDREERMVLLDGEMRIGSILLRTGDVHVSAAGSVHEDGRTLSPCLIILQYGA
jgi:hypothetical protein